MKVLITTAISLLAGLSMGFYVGYKYCDRHSTNEAVLAMVERDESSDALMAAISGHAIGLIESGQDQAAVQLLSGPVVRYYYFFATSTFTNEHRSKMRSMIEQLANTNQIVAAQIARAMKHGETNTIAK